MSIKNNNHIVENLFSKEQLDNLKNIIYTYYNNTEKIMVDLENIKSEGYPEHSIMIQPWSGRASFNVTSFLTEDILKTLNDYVISHGYDIESFSCLFVRYSNEFGGPSLGPHLDEHDTNFTIDYQLESNTDWDIVVDSHKYYLKDNSAVIFSPSEQIHWRTPKRFVDGQYVDMLLCYFKTNADSLNISLEEKRKLAEQYRSRYIEDYEKNMNGAS